jgi:hypothetical protein
MLPLEALQTAGCGQGRATWAVIASSSQIHRHQSHSQAYRIRAWEHCRRPVHQSPLFLLRWLAQSRTGCLTCVSARAVRNCVLVPASYAPQILGGVLLSVESDSRTQTCVLCLCFSRVKLAWYICVQLVRRGGECFVLRNERVRRGVVASVFGFEERRGARGRRRLRNKGEYFVVIVLRE